MKEAGKSNIVFRIIFLPIVDKGISEESPNVHALIDTIQEDRLYGDSFESRGTFSVVQIEDEAYDLKIPVTRTRLFTCSTTMVNENHGTIQKSLTSFRNIALFVLLDIGGAGS